MRRAGERVRGYPSDLTDAQWQVIAPHLPAEVPGRRGRPRVWPLRRIVEAILYLDRAGCAWRYLPADFPPWPTVYGYFAAWRDDGTLARLHDALRARVRAAAGRDPEPTAAVIDSQSVRAADTVPRASRGWDNAKKVNGRPETAYRRGRDGAAAGRGDHRRLRPGPRRRPATAVEPAPHLPPRPPDLGRRRLHRQARQLGRGLEDEPPDRPQAPGARLRGPAPPVGRGADLRLDQQAPPHCPRLRTPPRQPRSHGPLGHDRPHGLPPGPAQPFIKHSLSSRRRV